MIKRVEEYAKYVGITGFRNVKPEKPDQLLKMIRGKNRADVAVQFFDADLVATWKHLYFAVLDALTAFNTKRNISKSLVVEVMLYASAQRQIRKAIELLGVKPDCANVAVVIVTETRGVVEAALQLISEGFSCKPDEHVLELSPAKMQNIRTAFAITDQELAVVTKKGDSNRALVDIVVERAALLSTRL